MEKVTIIITTHNSDGRIKDTVESIFESTNHPFEIFIIESESTDGTDKVCDELAEKYDNVKVFHTKKMGPQKACNFGMKQTNNDVLLTHDDVIFHKFKRLDWLEKLSECCNSDDKIAIVTTLNGGGVAGPEYVEGFQWVGTWCTYIKRAVIDDIGYYDENMKIGDDIEYCYRIMNAGYRIVGMTNIFVEHDRGEPKEQDKNLKDMEDAQKYFRKKYNLDNSHLPVIIGIPVHNDLHCLDATLNSIMTSTRFFSKIILIESESTDTTDVYCDNIAKRYPFIEVIHTKKEGPMKAYNMLFDIAKKEKKDLFLTQTDVIFPSLYKKDWLQMMYIAAQEDGVGAVTSLNGTGTSGPDYVNNLRWLGGWCTYYPLKAIETVDGYDENFPTGYGVDIDHSYRLMKAGFNFSKINYWVHHHMMNEREHDMDPKTEEMKRKGMEYFKKKWGDVSHELD